MVKSSSTSNSPGTAELVMAVPVSPAPAHERESRGEGVHYHFDPVTGLPNLYKLMEDIDANARPALFLLNLIGFGRINGIFGYRAGNLLIEDVAKLLAEKVEGSPFRLYKLPGDEYGILTNLDGPHDDVEMTGKAVDWAELRATADDFAETVSNGEFCPFGCGVTPNFKLRLGVSIGIAVSVVVGKDHLLSRAQIALKTAKRKHRPHMFYRHSVRTKREFERELEWAQRLHSGLAADGIVPYFQPILDNKTGEIAKYEALARLIEPDGAVSTPEEFLPVAKPLRLHSRITRSMIGKGCELFGPTGKTLSLNLDMEDIVDRATADHILGCIEAHDMLGRVDFEILESQSIDNYGALRGFIERFRRLGCRFSIDDFGTGYSNFSHILKIGADYLKIDGSLIANIAKEEDALLVAANINRFAHELGLKTIAEYVADERTFAKVLELGIDYSQGNHIGKPEPYPADRLKLELI